MDAGFQDGIKTRRTGNVFRKKRGVLNWAILTRWIVSTSRGRNRLMKYPDWVCHDCGIKARGRPLAEWACPTWHMGRCDVCGEIKEVTEPRDFNFPEFKKHAKLTTKPKYL